MTQNTEASRAERAKPGDYGYSDSYAEVCKAVDREIALRDALEDALMALASNGEHCGASAQQKARIALANAKAVKVATPSTSPESLVMKPMESEDGRSGWYILHPDFFCDIEQENGVWSVFFRDVATGAEGYKERRAAPIVHPSGFTELEIKNLFHDSGEGA